MVQSKREIQSLLAAAEIRPLKRYGQNFLIDGNLLRKLVVAAEVRRSDVVLEVGPGTGTLSEELIGVAGHVVAVEIDKGMHALVSRRLLQVEAERDGVGRWTILHTDALARKSQITPAVLEALHEQQRKLGGRIMLVANLPYQIATPLIVNLLLGDLSVSPLCFTVQAEVAERLMAEPGGREYGPVSVYVQALADIRKIADVPAEAFWPQPQVQSTMLRIDCHTLALSAEVRHGLVKLVHECFLHRRKILKYPLCRLLNADAMAGLPADLLGRRPEQLGVADWLQLAHFCCTSNAR